MRIGVIGLGKIAQTKYFPALRKRPDVKLVRLCDQSESLTQQLCVYYGLPESAGVISVDGVIQAKPELVFVLTHTHYEIVKELLENEINVCVEKPLCWSLEQAEELAALAQKRRVLLFAAYMKQYDPAFQSFREAIQKRGLPLMLNVACYAGNNTRWCDAKYRIFKETQEENISAKQKLTDSWTAFHQKNGGHNRGSAELLLQLGIHQINLLHALLGEFQLKSCIIQENQGIRTVSALFRKDAVAVRYALIPVFSAPWLWEETYEAVYPDGILRYSPGCPFLSSSESRLRFVGVDGLGTQEQRFGVQDPFEQMIDALIQETGQTPPSATFAMQAIDDLRTIEEMLLVHEELI